MIFLFRYEAIIDNTIEEEQSHDHVWFARQVPRNACATVALINVVNNLDGRNLGPPLDALKASTSGMDAVARGNAIANDETIKRVHNSFARELDMWNDDLLAKDRHQKRLANIRAETRRLRQGTTKRNARRACEDDLDNSAFHFIAYMPIADGVWKLDGVQSTPRYLGQIEPASDWQTLARDAIQERINTNDDVNIHYSLLSVVNDPLSQARQDIAVLIASVNAAADSLVALGQNPVLVDYEMNGQRESLYEILWAINGLRGDYGVSDQMMQRENKLAQLSRDLTSPMIMAGELQRRIDAVEQRTWRLQMELRSQNDEKEKAMLRRQDYKPFLTAWVRMLRDQGSFEVLKAKVLAD